MLKTELARFLRQGLNEEKLEKLLENLDSPSSPIEEENILEGQSKEYYNNRLETAKRKTQELKAKLATASTPEKQVSVNSQIQKQKVLTYEYANKRKEASTENLSKDPLSIKKTVSESSEIKFKIRFINKNGQEETLDITAPSEEEARKKTLNMVDVKPDGIISIERKEDLEPAVIPTKDPKKYDDNIEKTEGDVNMKNKKTAIESVTESLKNIFDILKRNINEEEITDKGELAATPVATDDSEPEELTPDQDNDDLFPKEEHEEVEEVKEIVIESEISDTAEKAAEEVEKAGDVKKLNDAGSDTVDEKGELVTQPDQVAPKEVQSALIKESEEKLPSGKIKSSEIIASAKNDDLFPAEEHEESEEVEEVIVEEVTDKGDAAAEPVATDNSEPETLTPDQDNKDVFPAEDHKEVEEVEEIIVEAYFSAEDKAVKIEIPYGTGERFTSELSDKEREIVTEALRIIYGIYSGIALNEEETVEVPQDAEAELEVYEDKIVIEIPLATAPKKELSDDDKERISEAIEVLDAILKEEVDIDVSGEVQGTEITGELDSDDLFPAEEHEESEEVEEVIVEEVTDKGDAAAEPVATDDSEPETLTPDQDNKDVFPAEDHKEVEEVEEIIVEATKNGDARATSNTINKKMVTKFKKMTPEEKAKALENRPDFKLKNFVEEVTDKGDAAAEPVATDDSEPETLTPDQDNKDVFPAEDHKEVEEVKEIVVESEELNDAGSDTIDKDGSLDDNKSEPVKAEPSDVTTSEKLEKASEKISETVSYKSVKEAFLLENDYFAKDSYTLVDAKAKLTKLENQMALLVARDSGDPLYEELVRTTALAKKLQLQLQERYNLFGKEKASELITLKHEIDSDTSKLPKVDNEHKDIKNGTVATKELFDVDKQTTDVKEVIVESFKKRK